MGRRARIEAVKGFPLPLSGSGFPPHLNTPTAPRQRSTCQNKAATATNPPRWATAKKTKPPQASSTKISSHSPQQTMVAHKAATPTTEGRNEVGPIHQCLNTIMGGLWVYPCRGSIVPTIRCNSSNSSKVEVAVMEEDTIAIMNHLP